MPVTQHLELAQQLLLLPLQSIGLLLLLRLLPQLAAALQALVVVSGHCDNCQADEVSSALDELHLGVDLLYK